MKKHYFLYELSLNLLIFFLWIVPSLGFNGNSKTVFSEWNFPAQNLVLTIAAALICIIELKLNDERISVFQSKTGLSLIKKILLSLVCLIFLYAISITFQLAGNFMGIKIEAKEIAVPKGFTKTFFCALTFLFSACFEELVFRFYEPYSLNKLFAKVQNPYKYLIAEFLTALLFSICHLYLGFLAVLNAFFAHFIFRICLKRTENLLYPIAIHFLYNFTSLYLLSHAMQ